MAFSLKRCPPGWVTAAWLLLFVASGCAAPVLETATAGVTPAATTTADGEARPTQAVVAPWMAPPVLGPDAGGFPPGYNPLTGQPVSDPASLKLPAMLVSISNFPATARPQAGLSFAPYVFEFSITEGATRFLTVFYGDFPRPEVPFTGSCAVRMEPFQQTSPVILGNRVWLDANANGMQDYGEPGVGGVCVNLYDPSGRLTDQTTTDSNGYYGFNFFGDASAGPYSIQVLQPPGMQFTAPKAVNDDELDSDVDPASGRVQIEPRDTLLSVDAGLIPLPGITPAPDPTRVPLTAEVGPVRSGRLVYRHLASMFPYSCLLYAFASEEVQVRIPRCAMVTHGISGGGYMLPLSRMQSIAEEKSREAGEFDYASNLYTQDPPPGGIPATRLDVFFAWLNQSGWKYDPLMQSYLRYTDTSLEEEAGVLHPDTDRLTGRQLHFENIVILMTDHVVISPTNLDIDLEPGNRGPAYLFRDGLIYAVRWSTVAGQHEKATGQRSPIRWINLDDSPAALKPGHTWVIIVTPYSGFSRTGEGGWKLSFYPPDGAK
ncbi:MAG: SdrD B-like domain-containing protein [Bacteroidota bacterium]